ncbi:MAG: sensor histidine kinase [Betaproteobacteria bacterium HGW-Betaproteobacteria-13]|nr:MAG: sensor histidine kinase [Betaproteobacteria bacterium HGW-Betaproteobacteria-13]
MAERSLSGRIVTAFTLMTTVVAGLFALAIVIFINQAEVQLVAEGLNRQLDVIISTVSEGEKPYLGPELTLYRAPSADDATLPDWLRNLTPGFSEIEHDDVDWHVLTRDETGKRFILVLDQVEFGTLTAGKVIAPVIRLSGQVRHRDQLLSLAPPLAADYPADEVGQLAAAFDDTLNQLREALDRERLFTSDVSHELRTPLMVIASSCELLLETLPAEARERKQIKRIQHASEEMRELVETFMWLARGEQATRQPASMNTLQHIAEEQFRRWRPEAVQRNLTLQLTVEVPDETPYPTPMLRAVIANLLRNALHYTDKGGVQLVLQGKRFRVIDSGAGIPVSERLSVFRPFVRGGRTRGDGIGIGLSLVQRICTQQGWKIELSDAAGGGCVFEVDLANFTKI